MIVVNDDLLLTFAWQAFCEYCGRRPQVGTRLDPHHAFQKRGADGGSRLDLRKNLISLCRWCHNAAELDAGINSEMKQIIAKREKTTVDEIQQELWAILRKEKAGHPD